MPAWGDRLDDEDIDAVCAYVVEQADKWWSGYGRDSRLSWV